MKYIVKKFNTYINEDYFSKLANRKDNGNVRMENALTEDIVLKYCDEFASHIRHISIRKENGKNIVDIDGDYYLIKDFEENDLEEIPFQFGKVTGDFDCSHAKLTSLKGCPKEVGGNFYCPGCNNLTSLEGCPQKIGGSFICHLCVNLKSLKGCPIEVGKKFDCSCCDSLTSLEGCPQKMENGIFQCSWCHSLYHLGGLPTKLDQLYAINCGRKFTEQYVKNICNVKQICV